MSYKSPGDYLVQGPETGVKTDNPLTLILFAVQPGTVSFLPSSFFFKKKLSFCWCRTNKSKST